MSTINDELKQTLRKVQDLIHEEIDLSFEMGVEYGVEDLLDLDEVIEDYLRKHY